MINNLPSYMSLLVMAAAGLWILRFFQTTPYIRVSCTFHMSIAVTALWLVLIVTGVSIMLAALSLLELVIVLAILLILSLLAVQAGGPAMRKAGRAQRVLNAMDKVLSKLSGKQSGGAAKGALSGLGDFFAGNNGWDGTSGKTLAEIAEIINDLIDGEKGPDGTEGFTPTGIYDWLKENGGEVILGSFLDKLIERITHVLEFEELTDEEIAQLEKFKERLEKIRDARDLAENR